MSGKKGLIVGIFGLALIAMGIFISVISFGVALPGGLTLISTGLTLIQGVQAARALEHTGALQRSTPTADASALGSFVFGTTLVPMNLVYEEISGSEPDRVLHDVYAHAWHRIHSYQSLTVATDTGPEAVSFSGNAATGAYANLLWWFRADGTQSAALSGTPFDNNSWPSTAIFTGVAHSGLVWNIDDDNFKSKFSSIPTKVEAVVEGALLYDPRLDPTYGSGSQDYGTPSSWSFNDGNAALVLLRGIIGEYSGSALAWGRGAPETEINMASFITAANVADESLDGDVRYRLGGMWLLSGSFEEFVAQWEQETGGKLSKSGGQYTVWLPNDDLTPLTTITETDVVQGAAIQHTIAGGLDHLYNTARGRYIDAANGYVGKPYAEVNESAETTADGGKRVLSQDFSWVQSEASAQRIARIRVRRSRFQRVWVVPMGWKGQSPNYAVFSVHNLNCLETNYTNQLVRVIDRKMSYMGLTVLTLQQEDASIYDDTVALNDPLAGNNVTSKSSIFGTFQQPPSRYEERVTDSYFEESFGVAWDDDGNGGVSISVGGGEGGGNAMVLTDASVGTPRMAINQPSFAVEENEKITGYARMKRTANISLLQIGAQFYRSDTGAFVSATGDLIVQASEMPLLNTYYTVQFEFTTSTPGLPSGVRLLAAIDVDMTPTGGGTATITVSQIHARRSTDALNAQIPTSIIVHPSDTFTGTKVLKSTGAWEEPHPLTTAEVSATAVPVDQSVPPGYPQRFGGSSVASAATNVAAIQAAIDSNDRVVINEPFTINSAVVLRSGVELCFEGAGELILDGGVTTESLITGTSLTDVRIRSPLITGNGAAGVSSILLTTCDNVLIEGGAITKGGAMGVQLEGCTFVTVRDCELSQNYYYGVHDRDGTRNKYIGNRCYLNGDTGVATSAGGRGIFFWRCLDGYVAGNSFVANTEYGFRLYSEAADTDINRGHRIIGNYFEDNESADIVLYDESLAGTLVLRNIVSGNTVFRSTNPTLGMSVLLHGGDNTITDTHVFKNGSFGTFAGFYFYYAVRNRMLGCSAHNLADAVVFSNAENCEVDDFLGNVVATAAGPAGISLSGNIIRNSKFIHGGGGSTDVGIIHYNATGRNNIEGNLLDGFQYGVYVGDEAVTLRDNKTINSTSAGLRKDNDAQAGQEIIGNVWDSTNPALIQFLERRSAGTAVLYASAAPTIRTWAVGDICWNTGTTAGGVPGWVCTTAGTPGTWRAMAAVA